MRRKRVLHRHGHGMAPPRRANEFGIVENRDVVRNADRAPDLRQFARESPDLAQNFVRPVLTTIPGAAIPYSYGGKVRQLQIDLDSAALQSKGLSAQDIENTIAE